MAYRAILSSERELTIVNRGNQTSIALVSSRPGQQQSQTNSFTTGNWTAPPRLYKTGSGFILQINGDRGEDFILIQAHGIATIAAPELHDAVNIDLENIPDPPPRNSGFEPMQPMKMGNMSMDINRMSMQMGNMSMKMGGKTTPTSTRRFCSQCRTEAKTSDRFCSSCGHQLDN
jgi:hypothetical protein